MVSAHGMFYMGYTTGPPIRHTVGYPMKRNVPWVTMEYPMEDEMQWGATCKQCLPRPHAAPWGIHGASHGMPWDTSWHTGIPWYTMKYNGLTQVW